MKRESVAESGQEPLSRGADLVWLVIPALVAVVLALPCFRFTYLFDDSIENPDFETTGLGGRIR